MVFAFSFKENDKNLQLILSQEIMLTITYICYLSRGYQRMWVIKESDLYMRLQ